MRYQLVADLRAARGFLGQTPAHRTSADVDGIICGYKISLGTD